MYWIAEYQWICSVYIRVYRPTSTHAEHIRDKTSIALKEKKMLLKLGIFSGIRNRKRTRKSSVNRVMPSNFPVGIRLRHLVGLIISRGGAGTRVSLSSREDMLHRPRGSDLSLEPLNNLDYYSWSSLLCSSWTPEFTIYYFTLIRINGTSLCRYHFKVLILRCLLNNIAITLPGFSVPGWILRATFSESVAFLPQANRWACA